MVSDRFANDDRFNYAIVEVIRPAAVVPEDAAREILMELSLNSVTAGGCWQAEPSRWNRFDRPWAGPGNPGDAALLGTMQIAYGTPTRYEITIYRVTITHVGEQYGWTVRSLSDEALGFAGLTLAACPRATLTAPPSPFRY